jgi:hypothetical protein
MKKFIIILFLLVFITSCDPPHNINFINNTENITKVKFNLNPKVQNYSLNQISKGDSVVFNLKPKDTLNISFGIGTWSNVEIKELTNSIKNLEIETNDIKTIYKTKKSIYKILIDNRKGVWFKTNIEVEIK